MPQHFLILPHSHIIDAAYIVILSIFFHQVSSQLKLAIFLCRTLPLPHECRRWLLPRGFTGASLLLLILMDIMLLFLIAAIVAISAFICQGRSIIWWCDDAFGHMPPRYALYLWPISSLAIDAFIFTTSSLSTFTHLPRITSACLPPAPTRKMLHSPQNAAKQLNARRVLATLLTIIFRHDFLFSLFYFRQVIFRLPSHAMILIDTIYTYFAISLRFSSGSSRHMHDRWEASTCYDTQIGLNTASKMLSRNISHAN